jgi:hypothetical protein
MQDINDYVKAARLTKPTDYAKPAHSFYAQYLAAHPHLKDVEFIPIDSVQADTCLVPLNQRSYLIWDLNYIRWHSEVMATCLRSSRTRAEIESDEIIFRRAAELLNVNGFPERAYKATIIYRQVAQDKTARGLSDAHVLHNEVLAYILGIQELFIFYHEIGHLVFKRDETLWRTFLDEVTGLVDYEVNLPVDRPIGEAEIRSRMTLDNSTRDDASSSIYHIRRAIQAAYRTLRDDKLAMEELCCDMWAIDAFVDTGFDLKNRNERESLYAAILQQGQIQAAFNSLKQRCRSPESMPQEIVDYLAQITQARNQARMGKLMEHITHQCGATSGDLDAEVPFRRMFEEVNGLFWRIFVPRLYTTIFEELPYSIDGGKAEVHRHGVFGPLTGHESYFVLETDRGPIEIASITGQDLDHLVSFMLGWGRVAPDKELEISIGLKRES